MLRTEEHHERRLRNRTAIVTGFALAIGAARVQSATPAVAAHTVRASGLGVDVVVRYQLHPADHPGDEVDPGPYLGSGTISIASAAGHAHTTLSLAAIEALPPSSPQIVAASAAQGCGASGPIAIEKNGTAKYPAVVVTTIAIGKGCLPLAHVLVADETSGEYAPLASYEVTHPPRAFLGLRVPPLHADATLRVSHVRTIALPNAPANLEFVIRNWTIAIVDGTDAAGKPATIAIDRPKSDELPTPGETISMFNARGDDLLRTIRLSAEHERRYETIHPPGAPLPTPPPPPVPPSATPSPTASPTPVTTETPNAAASPSASP